MTLPQLTAPLTVTDGGLETTLVFHARDRPARLRRLPAARHRARAAPRSPPTTSPTSTSAVRLGTRFVVDTPTWRANLDWGARLGYDADPARRRQPARRRVRPRARHQRARRSAEHVVNGVRRPTRRRLRGRRRPCRPSEAAAYHGLQARAFAEAGAAMMTAVTMTYADEAIGVVRAAGSVGLPVVISFTVETDGAPAVGRAARRRDRPRRRRHRRDARLLHGQLRPPDALRRALDTGAAWLRRVKAIRANASRCSHAELDDATELDRGDVADLAALVRAAAPILPDLRVVGGCCGTDHEHVSHRRGANRGAVVMPATCSGRTPSLVVVPTVDQITRHDDADPDENVWVGRRPVPTPIAVVDTDPSWPAQFEMLAARIRDALGEPCSGSSTSARQASPACPPSRSSTST